MLDDFVRKTGICERKIPVARNSPEGGRFAAAAGQPR
jgi:hypothetical protein